MADKCYIATLTQTGTNAPVATELANSLGALVWTRSSAGVYVGTLANTFVPLTSTTILIPSMTSVISAVVTDINSVTITCSGDGVLTAREVDILVSTHYCTFTDLERKLSRATLAQLANDTASATIADPVVIETILTNTDATIDSKAGQVYTIPLTMPEPLVTRIAIDIACYEAFQRRPVNMEMPKDWQVSRDKADKQLEDISNMLVRLSDSQTVVSEESNMNTSNTARIDFSDENNSESFY
jgi:phage gp36-like protein